MEVPLFRTHPFSFFLIRNVEILTLKVLTQPMLAMEEPQHCLTASTGWRAVHGMAVMDLSCAQIVRYVIDQITFTHLLLKINTTTYLAALKQKYKPRLSSSWNSKSSERFTQHIIDNPNSPCFSPLSLPFLAAFTFLPLCLSDLLLCALGLFQ